MANTWVKPHAIMKIAKAQKIQLNSMSRRFETRRARAKGIEKYATAITASEATCSQINSGSHNKHMPWGENIDESNRRSRKAHIATVTFLKCGICPRRYPASARPDPGSGIDVQGRVRRSR